jgi:aspartate aminotransferase-like enzyme
MKKQRLFTPGPCAAPAEVLLELARPIFHHRTDEFRELFRRVRADLRQLFYADYEVCALTSSGTGAMEAAVLNTMPPGTKALVASCGKFGERWEEICRLHGFECVMVAADYGKAVSPAAVKEALAKHPDVSTVFTTLCETSTGTLTDVKAIGAAVAGTKALLVVDAISGFLAEELRVKDWGVDIAVTGSQKALMLPPGLAFLSVSPRAWTRLEGFAPRSYYFDLRAYRKAGTDDDTPYTAAHTLLAAAAKALEMIKAEGLQNNHRHIARQAAATRAGVQAMGLSLFSEAPANAVTAVRPPEGTADTIVKELKSRYGITVAGGQGSMKGKLFRIGHIGYVDDLDTLGVLAATESVLIKLGVPGKPGAAAAAAQEVFARG